ncbi:MAG: sigma-70 family RNA polymerase sigma factor [Pirellulales bacterium]|nr:sigma-70 family RNA polymerase sigma factor [Pirellulales bacterium]
MSQARQQWIARLTGEEPVCSDALTELRELLLARLQKSFRNRPDLSSGFLEDIVQESLLKILNNLEQFEGRSQFLTWATTIAVRTTFSELRKKQWKDVSLEQLLTDTREPGSLSMEQKAASDQKDLEEAMYQVIRERLSPKQRDALLAELKGMPLEEIARKTSSTRNAVYKLTHDARKQLKKRLEEVGYSSQDWQAMRR